MDLQKAELLALLSQECEIYSSIPASEKLQKRDKKHFINGLMKACRVVGISYEELSAIIDSMPKSPRFKDLDEQLSIPTYIRNNVSIQI
ncbi:TPA: hypothetical protein ACMD08_004498 [Vibrio parahaemolyticus]|uniref:hypothetical protein n=1 Tax=Vibrio parahaemolyticus TaxID=670 RepID=UPI0011246DD8|nr:hypothetical protein [Vibrio parahaemolyticus]EHR5764870.1 hypothetical protein [Vibrio parahaemolyticus]EHY0932630.1 hypothetical protein [Vibrio parahaemolyticus]EJC6832033.1 hypothetical protein [Vibrio parahaemolyticus]ELA9595922.1 hypothetical protein [Vibrio parahaemolyticus]MDF4381644.1 hypothetical protein [Vibrio parahaemolyticus]